MTKIEREQLNNLSKLVYGKSSRWHKLVNKGTISDFVDETGRNYRGLKYSTLDEVKSNMEKIWSEEQERIAKKAEEDANKKFHEEMKNEEIFKIEQKKDKSMESTS